MPLSSSILNRWFYLDCRILLEESHIYQEVMLMSHLCKFVLEINVWSHTHRHFILSLTLLFLFLLSQNFQEVKMGYQACYYITSKSSNFVAKIWRLVCIFSFSCLLCVNRQIIWAVDSIIFKSEKIQDFS